MRKFLLVGAAILVAAALGFILWANAALGPEPEAFAALRSDEHVTVSANLPAGTNFEGIDGGNHGQSGDYGFQPGDHPATIPRAEQQKQVVDATVKFLKEISQ